MPPPLCSRPASLGRHPWAIPASGNLPHAGFAVLPSRRSARQAHQPIIVQRRYDGNVGHPRTAGESAGIRLWRTMSGAKVVIRAATSRLAFRDHIALIAAIALARPVAPLVSGAQTTTSWPPWASSAASSSTTLFSPDRLPDRYCEWGSYLQWAALAPALGTFPLPAGRLGWLLLGATVYGDPPYPW